MMACQSRVAIFSRAAKQTLKLFIITIPQASPSFPGRNPDFVREPGKARHECCHPTFFTKAIVWQCGGDFALQIIPLLKRIPVSGLHRATHPEIARK